MKIGDIVRNKKNGIYATVEYSSFGVSLHWWNEERNGLVKTIGDHPSSYKDDWEVVDLPKGYEVFYGGVRKIKEDGDDV